MNKRNAKFLFLSFIGENEPDPMADFLSDLSDDVPEIDAEISDGGEEGTGGDEEDPDLVPDPADKEVPNPEEAAPEPKQDELKTDPSKKKQEEDPQPEVDKNQPPKEEQQPVVPEQPSEEQLQAQIEKLRGELEVRYAISDEDADLIATDPQTILPKLMANMHMMMQGEFLNMISRALPQMIQQYNTQTSVVNTAQEIFNRDFPDVNTASPEVVKMAIQQVNAAMPTATVEERVQRVGQVVYAMLGKTLQAQAPAPTPAPAPKPKPQPQNPARGSAAPAPAQPKNEMEQFFASF